MPARRTVVRAGAVAIVVVIVLTGVTARLFVWPTADAPTERADAVVVFVGGRGERLAVAERLLADGLAPNLVLPNGTAPEWPAGNRACSGDFPFEVHCPRPDPDTTRGEARVIAALAREKGWTRVIVVTSSYQLTRARLLLGRCFDGEVLGVRAQPELSASAWTRRVVHEWLGWMQAQTSERGC
jgi:uncharacterized SAM-binding protein YcdF (DUF218 family)